MYVWKWFLYHLKFNCSNCSCTMVQVKSIHTQYWQILKIHMYIPYWPSLRTIKYCPKFKIGPEILIYWEKQIAQGHMHKRRNCFNRKPNYCCWSCIFILCLLKSLSPWKCQSLKTFCLSSWIHWAASYILCLSHQRCAQWMPLMTSHIDCCPAKT